MEKVLETFKTCNKSGDGLISYAELALLLRTVDPAITEDNFQIMMEETGASSEDKMKFEEFVGWLNGDRGAPEVMKPSKASGEQSAEKAATGQEAEEEDDDDEKSIEDEEDVDMLAAEIDLGGVDLDLDQRIVRKEWMAMMGELGIDPAEGSDNFDDIAEDGAKYGFGTPEEGYPLRECLDELKVELDDIEGLRAIAKAVVAAKAKVQQGEQPAEAPIWNATSVDVALDHLVRELDQAGRPAEDAWDFYKEGKVMLGKKPRAALDSFSDRKDELVAKVKECMVSPPLVSATCGQTASRLCCTEAIDKIIEKCKADGKPFTDPDWDMTTDPNAVLYVDKGAPGYDCTVGKPAGYKRLTEIIKDPVLFKDGIRPGDIIQGQIGTCFLLGAMGAIVSKDEKALRKIFIKHDVEAGVYGVRFCLDGEWMYVIVDDVMPVNAYGSLLYAHSKDPQEVWCPILEKAYCKLHRCYEMCDGGFSTEAIFNFFGGVSGKIDLKEAHQKDPVSYFKLLKQARSHGWLLTTHFAPKKGAMGGAGKCGEATFDSGLVGGHCYSVLKCVEACGNHLVCCRNPWGTGEWKGKWSDKNAEGEWTDEMKEATGYKGINDGKFWMSVHDFVENSGGVRYARPFGLNWKRLSQYKRFRNTSMTATAKYTYAARADDEISIQKGGQVEIKSLSAGWWYGTSADGKEGYFPGNYVRLNDRPVARFDLMGERAEGANEMTVVVLLMQPDSTRLRHFYKRKEDGLNYKDTSYPCIQLCVVGPDGKVHTKKRARAREVWAELKIPGGEGWKIYAYSVSGTGSAFVLRAYVKDGTATMKEVPDVQISELMAAIAKK